MNLKFFNKIRDIMEEDEVNLMPKKARTYVSLEDKLHIIGLIKAGV